MVSSMSALASIIVGDVLSIVDAYLCHPQVAGKLLPCRFTEHHRE